MAATVQLEISAEGSKAVQEIVKLANAQVLLTGETEKAARASHKQAESTETAAESFARLEERIKSTVRTGLEITGIALLIDKATEAVFRLDDKLKSTAERQQEIGRQPAAANLNNEEMALAALSGASFARTPERSIATFEKMKAIPQNRGDAAAADHDAQEAFRLQALGVGDEDSANVIRFFRRDEKSAGRAGASLLTAAEESALSPAEFAAAGRALPEFRDPETALAVEANLSQVATTPKQLTSMLSEAGQTLTGTNDFSKNLQQRLTADRMRAEGAGDNAIKTALEKEGLQFKDRTAQREFMEQTPEGIASEFGDDVSSLDEFERLRLAREVSPEARSEDLIERRKGLAELKVTGDSGQAALGALTSDSGFARLEETREAMETAPEDLSQQKLDERLGSNALFSEAFTKDKDTQTAEAYKLVDTKARGSAIGRARAADRLKQLPELLQGYALTDKGEPTKLGRAFDAALHPEDMKLLNMTPDQLSAEEKKQRDAADRKIERAKESLGIRGAESGADYYPELELAQELGVAPLKDIRGVPVRKTFGPAPHEGPIGTKPSDNILQTEVNRFKKLPETMLGGSDSDEPAENKHSTTDTHTPPPKGQEPKPENNSERFEIAMTREAWDFLKTHAPPMPKSFLPEPDGRAEIPQIAVTRKALEAARNVVTPGTPANEGIQEFTKAIADSARVFDPRFQLKTMMDGWGAGGAIAARLEAARLRAYAERETAEKPRVRALAEAETIEKSGKFNPLLRNFEAERIAEDPEEAERLEREQAERRAREIEEQKAFAERNRARANREVLQQRTSTLRETATGKINLGYEDAGLSDLAAAEAMERTRDSDRDSPANKAYSERILSDPKQRERLEHDQERRERGDEPRGFNLTPETAAALQAAVAAAVQPLTKALEDTTRALQQHSPAATNTLSLDDRTPVNRYVGNLPRVGHTERE